MLGPSDKPAPESRMIHTSSPFETSPQAAPSRPLLSALTRWWPGAGPAPATDMALGYECALPWTLEDAPRENVEPS